MSSAPNRYSQKHTHAAYGVQAWLKGCGITTENLVVSFAEENGFLFDESHRRLSRKRMYVFVSNRFEDFMKYVAASVDKQKNLTP